MTEDENVNSEKLKISISIPLKLPKVFLFNSMPHSLFKILIQNEFALIWRSILYVGMKTHKKNINMIFSEQIPVNSKI